MLRLQTRLLTTAGRYFGLIAFPLALVARVPAGATTLTVTSSADDVAQNHTLRYAVAHAQNGDTIQLTAAIKAPIVLTNGDIVLGKNVTIQSVAARTPTISGSNTSRIFEISGATVTFSNLNFTAGSGICNNPNGDASWDGYGGAVLVDAGGALSVRNCSFTENQCSQGGAAIELVGNSLTITKSSFVGGEADYGTAIDGENYFGTDTMSISDSEFVNNSTAQEDGFGGVITPAGGKYTLARCNFHDNSNLNCSSGVIFNSSGNMTLTDSTVENNFGGSGGVVGTNGGTMSISGCTLLNNSVEYGGSVLNEFGTMIVSHCTMENNTNDGGSGGAIWNDGNMTVTDCNLSGNSTSDSGGGAIWNDGMLTLTDCILFNNSASGYFGLGGGIYNEGTILMTRCILYGNSASESGGGIWNSLDGTLSIGASLFIGNTPNAIGGDDPSYTNLGRNIFL